MTQNIFPKTDGLALYASEANNMIKTKGLITRLANPLPIQTGFTTYNEGNNTIIEYYQSPNAGSVTNLTHNTNVDEYFSVADGAYELITDNYYLDSNATRCSAFFDYNIYKEISETDQTSTRAGGIDDTDNSAQLNGEKVVYTKFKLYCCEDGIGTSITAIKLTDGTLTSDIITYTPVGSGTGKNSTVYGYIKLIIDTTNHRVKYNVVGEERIEAVFSGAAGVTYIYYRDINTFGEIDTSTWDGDIYLQTSAISANGTYATLYYIRAEKLNPTTTAVISVSSNGGVTWNALDSNYSITDFTAAGANIKAKIAGTLAAGEGINIKGVILKPEP